MNNYRNYINNCYALPINYIIYNPIGLTCGINISQLTPGL